MVGDTRPPARSTSDEEISPKDRPAPETMGLGSHQRLPFLDVGRFFGTVHRMAPAALSTSLRRSGVHVGRLKNRDEIQSFSDTDCVYMYRLWC